MTPSAGQLDSMKTQQERKHNEDQMAALKKANDFLLQQNQEMTTELTEFKQLMHADGTRDPSTQGMSPQDKLKKMAASLKSQNELLKDENQELGKILQAFRDGNYNQVEGAKMLAEE